MQQTMWRQVHGAKDLAQDAVGATIDAVAEIQHDITRVPYAVLTRIPGIRAPARGIEQLQQAITAGTYNGIRAVVLIAGSAVTSLLNHLEEPCSGAEVPQPDQPTEGSEGLTPDT